MSSPVAFTMLKFAGAAYLLYLGVKAFLARRENHFELSGDAAVSGKLYRKGILMNILNPKVILFFLAFFPQFIDKGIENPIPQMLFLGLVFIGGIWIFLSHIFWGVLFCITIIGIPFGMQHFKLAGLALTPFGHDVK